MSNGRRKPLLDMQACYSGFKIDELEYIGYSRSTDEHEDDFLDNFDSKLDNGGSTSDEEDGVEGEYTSASFSTEGFRSYLCSTPTAGRRHRGSFPQDEELSEFNEVEYFRSFPTTNANDSGLQTQSISEANSVASFFGDEMLGEGSLESLPGSSKGFHQHNMRKRIELDSDIHNPYSNVDELELSIEEEHSTSTLGTLKRRLSLKVIRKSISTGLFGSYLQRSSELPALPASHSQHSMGMSTDQAPLMMNNSNKPTGPVNLWFRKFRNRHFI